MSDIRGLDFRDLYLLLEAASQNLENNVEIVNSLNVFPVPDGDTGTNMQLTLKATFEELEERKPSSMKEFTEAVVKGSLLGARGNSGVILSQLFRGLCRSLDSKDLIFPPDLALAFQEAVKAAYQAVMKPVEGTILTVAKDASLAASQAKALDWGDFFKQVEEAARVSLANTPNLLPVLKEAGVVDAGGQGLLFLLEGARAYLTGETLEKRAKATEASTQEEESLDYRYDLQFLIRGQNLKREEIEADLAPLGDSLLVVGSEDLLKVHIHVNDPFKVLEKVAQRGFLDKLTLEDMQQQYEEFKRSTPQTQVVGPGLVAVSYGQGFEEIFSSLGVSEIVKGGQSMNPSCGEILDAISACPNTEVILLPNNPNVIGTALQAKALAKKKVGVVPSRNLPQGISACVAFQPRKSFQENLQAMERAMEKVSCGEVTYAVREGSLNGVSFQSGEVIGLLNEELVSAGQEIGGVCLDLIEKMLERFPQASVLTIYRGEEVLEDDAQEVVDQILEKHPGLEVDLLYGGQPYYYYVISLE
ncbi:MAG: DAK2 domain-containing protein [Caldiserica bacterium]|jgi:DAK2 domain fusion protein YloV|nr:DAK2 domain-containing protein [Caldisericota bacterium]MDH7562958.1 DAK2 domain-containing protein [Caldisericota bacterium]